MHLGLDGAHVALNPPGLCARHRHLLRRRGHLVRVGVRVRVRLPQLFLLPTQMIDLLHAQPQLLPQLLLDLRVPLLVP